MILDPLFDMLDPILDDSFHCFILPSSFDTAPKYVRYVCLSLFLDPAGASLVYCHILRFYIITTPLRARFNYTLVLAVQ